MAIHRKTVEVVEFSLPDFGLNQKLQVERACHLVFGEQTTKCEMDLSLKSLSGTPTNTFLNKKKTCSDHIVPRVPRLRLASARLAAWDHARDRATLT